MRDRRLAQLMQNHEGVVRTSALLSLGVSRHQLAAAVSAGHVVRIARGWVAEPDADPYLTAAARARVVVTCITQAKRLGLWVLDDGMVHVGARSNGKHSAHSARVHWCRPLVPRHPDALADSIENVLVIIAACQPHENALAVWESAVNRGLVSLDAMRRLRLTGAACALAAEVTPWSDSGLETIFAVRLRWMRLPIVPQVWLAGHRVDFVIGERLVVQIDGGHHVGAQRAQDIAHDAELALLGYTVIRVTYGQVVGQWAEVQDRIMRAVAQGLHLAR